MNRDCHFKIKALSSKEDMEKPHFSNVSHDTRPQIMTTLSVPYIDFTSVHILPGCFVVQLNPLVAPSRLERPSLRKDIRSRRLHLLWCESFQLRRTALFACFPGQWRVRKACSDKSLSMITGGHRERRIVLHIPCRLGPRSVFLCGKKIWTLWYSCTLCG